MQPNVLCGVENVHVHCTCEKIPTCTRSPSHHVFVQPKSKCDFAYESGSHCESLLSTEGSYDLLLPLRSSAEHVVQRMRLRTRYHSNVVVCFGGMHAFFIPPMRHCNQLWVSHVLLLLARNIVLIRKTSKIICPCS